MVVFIAYSPKGAPSALAPSVKEVKEALDIINADYFQDKHRHLVSRKYSLKKVRLVPNKEKPESVLKTKVIEDLGFYTPVLDRLVPAAN
jgi:hypothetical protein